jgi:hypothetical protein
MSAPSGRVVIVNVPMGNFLMVDGRGDAESDGFRSAVRTLTDFSAALRLYLQDGDGTLFDPMPLEILWSMPGDEVWHEALPAPWSWTAMIAQPARVTPELVAAVRERLQADLTQDPLCRVRLGSLREGLSAQTVSSRVAERSRDVHERLVAHVRSLGYEPHGPHHEIYLADLRHRAAASLRTIIRQPIHSAA